MPNTVSLNLSLLVNSTQSFTPLFLSLFSLLPTPPPLPSSNHSRSRVFKKKFIDLLHTTTISNQYYILLHKFSRLGSSVIIYFSNLLQPRKQLLTVVDHIPHCHLESLEIGNSNIIECAKFIRVMFTCYVISDTWIIGVYNS